MILNSYDLNLIIRWHLQIYNVLSLLFFYHNCLSITWGLNMLLCFCRIMNQVHINTSSTLRIELQTINLQFILLFCLINRTNKNEHACSLKYTNACAEQSSHMTADWPEFRKYWKMNWWEILLLEKISNLISKILWHTEYTIALIRYNDKRYNLNL